MHKRFLLISLILLIIAAYSQLMAQSADARVCTCFAAQVPDNFLSGTRVQLGVVSTPLIKDTLLQPLHGQPVKFTMPLPVLKPGCRAVYTLYVADSAGNKIYELTGRMNTVSYTFPACDKTYQVSLLVTGKNETAGAGNCTRRIGFRVKARCNTVTCNCFVLKGKTSPVSADLNLNGRLECIPQASGPRKFVLKFGLVNKTSCQLKLQTLNVFGQDIDVSFITVDPSGTKEGFSLGVNATSAEPAPAGTVVPVKIGYSLNGKKCSMTADIPFSNCQ